MSQPISTIPTFPNFSNATPVPDCHSITIRNNLLRP